MDKPEIEFWYGNHQEFGRAGITQNYFNVLGRVTSIAPIKSVQYSVNGSSYKNLSIGPDRRRLVSIGDFNIDISLDLLSYGLNKISVVAEDERNQTSEEFLSVMYFNGEGKLPLHLEWKDFSKLQKAANVVDGNWGIEAGKIFPYEIGYDRLIAIGDCNWRDYEVQIPITIHGFNGSCYEFPSIHAGVGVVMRWNGHTDWGSDPYASGQPFFGPGPYGAIGWCCFFHGLDPEINFFDPEFKRMAKKNLKIVFHKPYIFKLRVETRSNNESMYCMKVWDADSPEPINWDISSIGHPNSLRNGSCMLAAHHVSASFGDLLVTPI